MRGATVSNLPHPEPGGILIFRRRSGPAWSTGPPSAPLNRGWGNRLGAPERMSCARMKGRFRPWAIALGLIMLGALGYAFWGRRSDPPAYVTAEVTRGPVTRTITTTGAVDPGHHGAGRRLRLGHHPDLLLRLQHAGEGRPALRQDRSAPVPGGRRSGRRQPGERPGAAAARTRPASSTPRSATSATSGC